MTAVLLLLCAVDPDLLEAGSARAGDPALEAACAKSVGLSLKISRAKKRKRRVIFYKSVARQAKIRPTGARSPSSGR
jgi:hypothetical protein